MDSCPECGSPDITIIELAEVEADNLHEREDCEAQFREDEMVGFSEDF